MNDYKELIAKLNTKAEEYYNANAYEGELTDEGCKGFYFGILYAADVVEAVLNEAET